MKTSNILWILVIASLMLAVVGCGDDEGKEKIPSETVAVEGVGSNDTSAAAEPSVVDEEGVTDSGADVTSDVNEGGSMVNETEEPTPAEVDTSSETASGSEGAESSSNESSSSTKTAQNYRVVSLKDLKAYPEEMTIKVGTTVEWRNVNDNLQHIIGWKGQAQDGVKPEPILQGESWSYTFNSPGVVKWFSTARPTTQGVITVEE